MLRCDLSIDDGLLVQGINHSLTRPACVALYIARMWRAGYGMTPMEYTRTSAMRSHALPWLYSLPMRAAEAIGADYHR